MMQISHFITSRWCSVGLRFADSGSHLSVVNLLSCSRNPDDLSFETWHITLWEAAISTGVYCGHNDIQQYSGQLWHLNDAQSVLKNQNVVIISFSNNTDPTIQRNYNSSNQAACFQFSIFSLSFLLSTQRIRTSFGLGSPHEIRIQNSSSGIDVLI